ncbi:MAG: hypothetical protein WBA97_00635 [Actinophytocola sp.]|uniref:hypothetical protein n=1 Tax=Actinophytocola sp. TaxID=1872138 RepID=UPI003C791397
MLSVEHTLGVGVEEARLHARCDRTEQCRAQQDTGDHLPDHPRLFHQQRETAADGRGRQHDQQSGQHMDGQLEIRSHNVSKFCVS